MLLWLSFHSAGEEAETRGREGEVQFGRANALYNTQHFFLFFSFILFSKAVYVTLADPELAM